MKNFICQQDGAPPHWDNSVRDWLNFIEPYFYLWGFIKDVYVPPQSDDLPDLNNRIEAAVTTITLDTLIQVLEELGYRLDVCSVANGYHIEHI
ncbi:hypothetical protein J6590_022849 [Homalodisca vitripennis]|nr:hypothetical protein J6590_022849 [Homalodisca vitripennis]